MKQVDRAETGERKVREQMNQVRADMANVQNEAIKLNADLSGKISTMTAERDEAIRQRDGQRLYWENTAMTSIGPTAEDLKREIEAVQSERMNKVKLGHCNSSNCLRLHVHTLPLTCAHASHIARQ